MAEDGGVMRELSPVTCLVIVAESVVEQTLLRGIAGCGARGWTVTGGRGHGPRNRGLSEIEGGNVRIETLVSPEVAVRIWELLESDYFVDYAVTAWQHEAHVARAERYLG